MTTSATVAEAVIQNNKTAIQLSRGTLHLYGLAIGGPGTSTLFSDGQYASVFHEAGLLGAALAYGKNSQVRFTTKTNNHAIGGVSIGGSWDTFHAFYGSNATKGASSAAANFTVSENSLVVVIGLAASQQSLKLVGIPALQIDASNSGAAADGAMVLAHTYLGPGKYTLTEQSSGRPGVMDDDYRADLVGIFVFGSKP